MGTEILEGTVAEIRRQLERLPYPPDQRLRVAITAPEPPPAPPVEAFHPAGFRNGVPLLPHRDLAQPVTLELVKTLLEEEAPGAAPAG